jgi:hypothetical protein
MLVSQQVLRKRATVEFNALNGLVNPPGSGPSCGGSPLRSTLAWRPVSGLTKRQRGAAEPRSAGYRVHGAPKTSWQPCTSCLA